MSQAFGNFEDFEDFVNFATNSFPNYHSKTVDVRKSDVEVFPLSLE